MDLRDLDRLVDDLVNLDAYWWHRCFSNMDGVDSPSESQRDALPVFEANPAQTDLTNQGA